jgi:hypothetical protein
MSREAPGPIGPTARYWKGVGFDMSEQETVNVWFGSGAGAPSESSSPQSSGRTLIVKEAVPPWAVGSSYPRSVSEFDSHSKSAESNTRSTLTTGTSNVKTRSWQELESQGTTDRLLEVEREAATFGELVVVLVLGTATESAIRTAGPQNFVGKTVIDATNPLDFSGGGGTTLEMEPARFGPRSGPYYRGDQ